MVGKTHNAFILEFASIVTEREKMIYIQGNAYE